MPGWQAAGHRAGSCARRPARRTRIWPGPGCYHPRRRAPDGPARPAGQAARVPQRLPAVTLIVILPAARPRYAQVDRAPSPPALAPRLRHHGHEPEREAPVPVDDRIQQLITAGNGRRRGAGPGGVSARDGAAPSLAGSHSGGPARVCCRRGGSRVPPPARRGRPGTSPVLGRTPRSSRPAFPRLPGTGPGKTFLPGRIRHGPSMYEMEGPCPASPRRLASCLVFAARRAPPAGAKYPRDGPVSRLLPRSRRRPRVVPVSSGESIITTAASTAQAPQPAISYFSAIHGRLHRKQAVIRISQRLSTGLFTACPQATGCKPENT